MGGEHGKAVSKNIVGMRWNKKLVPTLENMSSVGMQSNIQQNLPRSGLESSQGNLRPQKPI